MHRVVRLSATTRSSRRGRRERPSTTRTVREVVTPWTTDGRPTTPRPTDLPPGVREGGVPEEREKGRPTEVAGRTDGQTVRGVQGRGP